MNKLHYSRNYHQYISFLLVQRKERTSQIEGNAQRMTEKQGGARIRGSALTWASHSAMLSKGKSPLPRAISHVVKKKKKNLVVKPFNAFILTQNQSSC